MPPIGYKEASNRWHGSPRLFAFYLLYLLLSVSTSLRIFLSFQHHRDMRNAPG